MMKRKKNALGSASEEMHRKGPGDEGTISGGQHMFFKINTRGNWPTGVFLLVLFRLQVSETSTAKKCRRTNGNIRRLASL